MGEKYMGFSRDHDPNDARQKFIAKYGHPPLKVYTSGTALLVGPITRVEQPAPDIVEIGRELEQLAQELEGRF